MINLDINLSMIHISISTMLSSYTCCHVIRVLTCTWFSQTKTWLSTVFSFIYLFNSQLILFQLSFDFDQIYAFYGIWFKRDDFCFRFFRLSVCLSVCLYVCMYVCLFILLSFQPELWKNDQRNYFKSLQTGHLVLASYLSEPLFLSGRQHQLNSVDFIF